MSLPFDKKYRPKTLDQVIGHEPAVARLKGIIASGKFPAAMLFMGPTSVGKTTLARCFAADVNEAKIQGHPDYLEINAGATGKIENIRELLSVSTLMPQKGKRRFIVIDECFTEETEVEVKPGEFLSIRQVVEDRIPSVISRNMETGDIEEKEILGAIVKEIEEGNLMEIVLEDGTIFNCSASHKWWCTNKNMWVLSSELEEGDDFLFKPA